MEKTIDWNITQQEAKYILDMLGYRPLNEVRDLHDKLVMQTRDCIEEKPETGDDL